MRKLMFFVFLSLIGIQLGLSQSHSISGKVVSAEDNEPVIGATVLLKGTSTGTITDADGKFTITPTASSKILVISFIGMKPVEVEAKDGMVVKLETGATELGEITVAFGTSNKKSYTGSAAVIKAESIEKNQTSNVSNTLAGKVAGIQGLSSNGQPGEGSKIRIRGVGSMNASNEPLYVVDGVPFDSDISSISNSDIESVTVLKDAASAALYGARGANGVVIITTKRGTGDGKNAKIKVDAKWGNNQRAVPSYKVMTDPAMYYETFYRALYNSRVNTAGADAAHDFANRVLLDASNGGLGYQVYSVPQGQRLIGTNFKLNPNATAGYSDGKYTYLADNWYNEIFQKNNMRQEYNVSASGSNDKLNYFASGGFLKDAGTIPNSDYQRFTARLNADYQAKKWLKIITNMSYVRADSRYPDDQASDRSSGNVFYLSNMLAPIYPLYIRDAEGNKMTDARGFTMYDYGDGKIAKAVRPFMNNSNPASQLQLNVEKFGYNYFTGKWSAVAEIYDGLKATATVGLNTADIKYNMLMNSYYGQYAENGGYIQAQTQNILGLNQQYLITYNKHFGLHNIDALAGADAYSLRNSVLWGTQEKIYQDRIPELNNAIVKPHTGSYTYNYAVLGFLAQVKYDYDSKYFGSVSYRRDGSSMFAPENRWGDFWSVGAAWNMSGENFLQDIEQINLLKLKISYGAQGNDKLYYDGTTTINYQPYADQYDVTENNGEFATARSYKGNRDITWETSYNFNAGIDFSLFNERLGGTIEGFSRKTEDMLYYEPVRASLGYTFLPVNIGSVRNSGFEIDLNGSIVKTNSLTWKLYANATFLSNKILKLHPKLQGQWISGSYIYREGSSMYNFYIREFAGVDEATGDAMWYKDIKDEDGKITGRETTKTWSTATQYEQGNVMPKVYGGFGTTLDTYGFDISVDFAYQLGGRVYDNTYAVLMHSGYSADAGRNWHGDILNAWTPENTKTDIPRLNSGDQYANATSTRFLTSSNYLSLNNITIGYSLPGKLLQKLKIEKLRVFAVADNVALFSARQGFDPRQSYTVSYSGSLYTPIRSVSGGISITF